MKPVDARQSLHNLRTFLVWRFIWVLIATGTVELLVVKVISVHIYPLFRSIFWGDVPMDRDISSGVVLGVLAMILVELCILLIGSFLPGSWQPLVNSVSFDIEEFIYKQMPELQHAAVPRMNFGKELLLFCMLLLVMVLLCLPLVIASGVYATMVAKQMTRIEAVREEEYIEHDRRRNLMLSDIAHDLRTPITTISGYAKALHDGMVEEEDKKQEYLEAIMNKSGRMEELIQLLFEYSKLNSAGFTLHMERGDLAEFLRENAALVYDNVESAGMELEMDVPEDVCMASFDSLQLGRVITNLITNAIKHNPSGTKICLSLKWNHFDENYAIRVADTGDVIPPEVAAHLFEPFAVGDASRSTKGGSGLGLSIASTIVEMHGSKLVLEEHVTGYTKAFTFELQNQEV